MKLLDLFIYALIMSSKCYIAYRCVAIIYFIELANVDIEKLKVIKIIIY